MDETRRIARNINRFWLRIKKNTGNGCWEWTAHKDPDGYGRIWINGKCVRAHRYSWELHNRSIPNDMCVLHHCDNPKCVKPAHLFIGTSGDNNRDCVAKGRHSSGTIKGTAMVAKKLSNIEVRVIRIYYPTLKQKILAEIFNVDPSTISRIIAGRSRKTVYG